MNDEGDMGTHPSEDLAAFALGALDAAEEASVRGHVARCERCRAELRWLEPAVDVLPASVPQVEPPRGLKRNLMKEVRADAREESGGWWSRRAGWVSMRARPALAIGAVALLGAGVAGFLVSEANRAPTSTVTNVKAEPAGAASNANGMLETSDDGAVLTVAGMPALERGDVYQAWFSDGGVNKPAKAFTVGAGGDGEADLGEIPAGTDEVLVTEESAADLPAPEGDVVLSAPVA
jgi:hypothetical protein